MPLTISAFVLPSAADSLETTYPHTNTSRSLLFLLAASTTGQGGRKRKLYNVYGVVVDFRGVQRRRPESSSMYEYHSSITLVDDSTRGACQPLYIDCYAHSKDRIAPPNGTGYILRVHRLQVRRIVDHKLKVTALQGRAYGHSLILSFEPSVHASFIPLRIPLFISHVAFFATDRARIRQLRKWIASNGVPFVKSPHLESSALGAPGLLSLYCTVYHVRESGDECTFSIKTVRHSESMEIDDRASQSAEIVLPRTYSCDMPTLPHSAIFHEIRAWSPTSYTAGDVDPTLVWLYPMLAQGGRPPSQLPYLKWDSA